MPPDARTSTTIPYPVACFLLDLLAAGRDCGWDFSWHQWFHEEWHPQLIRLCEESEAARHRKAPDAP